MLRALTGVGRALTGGGALLRVGAVGRALTCWGALLIGAVSGPEEGRGLTAGGALLIGAGGGAADGRGLTCCGALLIGAVGGPEAERSLLGALLIWAAAAIVPVSYTHLTLPTNREV